MPCAGSDVFCVCIYTFTVICNNCVDYQSLSAGEVTTQKAAITMLFCPPVVVRSSSTLQHNSKSCGSSIINRCDCLAIINNRLICLILTVIEFYSLRLTSHAPFSFLRSDGFTFAASRHRVLLRNAFKFGRNLCHASQLFWLFPVKNHGCTTFFVILNFHNRTCMI